MPKPGYKKNDFGYTIGGPDLEEQDILLLVSGMAQGPRAGQVSANLFLRMPNAPAISATCVRNHRKDFSDCPWYQGFMDANGHTPDLTVVPAFQANHAVSQALLGMIPAANAAHPEPRFLMPRRCSPPTGARS